MSLTAALPSFRARHRHANSHWEGDAKRRIASDSLARQALGAELREPFDALQALELDDMTIPILAALDRAIDASSLRLALALERLLPPTLGAEPAIVDRLVTLRLWEGDLATAIAGLGACPVETPRLTLLRTVARVRSGYSEPTNDSASDPVETGLVHRVLQALVSQTTQGRPKGPAHHGGDATVAVCAVVAGRPSPVATLTMALTHLERLLDADAALSTGTLTTAVLAALRGVAQDLGIALGSAPPADELAVTPSDRARLRLRAA